MVHYDKCKIQKMHRASFGKDLISDLIITAAIVNYVSQHKVLLQGKRANKEQRMVQMWRISD